MTVLTTTPNEGAAILITVEFKDFDNVLFTPKTLVWSLTTSKGVLVNNRDGVVETPNSSSHDFLLSGDDLLFIEDKGKRIFTVEGTFDSAYGNDLPFRDEASFVCKNTILDPL